MIILCGLSAFASAPSGHPGHLALNVPYLFYPLAFIL
jgi:hypothetical protein